MVTVFALTSNSAQSPVALWSLADVTSTFWLARTLVSWAEPFLPSARLRQAGVAAVAGDQLDVRIVNSPCTACTAPRKVAVLAFSAMSSVSASMSIGALGSVRKTKPPLGLAVAGCALGCGPAGGGAWKKRAAMRPAG